MIKINLIPVKEKKKRQELFIVFCILAFFGAVALVMVWIYAKKMSSANDLAVQINQVEEESKSYEDRIHEIKDLEKKEGDLEGFKKTVKSISETQRKVAVAVDQFAASLPEGVWLTGITQGKGADANKFTVQGFAFTQGNLEAYSKMLRRPNGYLKEVTLEIKNISASVGNNRQIHQFEINAKVMDQGS